MMSGRIGTAAVVLAVSAAVLCGCRSELQQSCDNHAGVLMFSLGQFYPENEIETVSSRLRPEITDTLVGIVSAAPRDIQSDYIEFFSGDEYLSGIAKVKYGGSNLLIRRKVEADLFNSLKFRHPQLAVFLQDNHTEIEEGVYRAVSRDKQRILVEQSGSRNFADAKDRYRKIMIAQFAAYGMNADEAERSAELKIPDFKQDEDLENDFIRMVFSSRFDGLSESYTASIRNGDDSGAARANSKIGEFVRFECPLLDFYNQNKLRRLQKLLKE